MGRRLGAAVSRRVLLGVLVMGLASVAGAVLVEGSAAAGGPVTVQVVVENPNFEILAVDPSGMTYGRLASADNGIWNSSDKGLTWRVAKGDMRHTVGKSRCFRKKPPLLPTRTL